MKKMFIILLFILSFLFIFPGCSSEEKPPLPESEIPAEEQPSEPVKYEPNINMEKSIIINAEREIKNSFWKKAFEEKGIDITLQNTRFTDEYHWEGEFFLKHSESKKELVIPITGVYADGGFVDIFGSFVILNDFEIAYCGKEKVFVFDNYLFENSGFEPKFPESEKEIWVNSIGFDINSEQYYLLLTEIDCPSETEGETFLCYYDREGNLLSKDILSDVFSVQRDSRFFPRFPRQFMVFEYKGEKYIYDKYKFIGTKSGKIYTVSSALSAENDWQSLKICLFYDSDKDFYENEKYMAFLYRNGYFIDCFSFNEDNLSTVYNTEDEISLFGDEQKIVYYSDHFAMTLELDFENETHKLLYNPTDRHTNGGTGTKSPDGKFTICSFGETSGGDAIDWHNAIRDNETGKYTYIGRSGGMWGGYGGLGFFKNNDVYIWSTNKMQVLDPKTGKIKFDLTENFPLGHDEKTDSERGLLTFRRDPEDLSYIVVYYEYENGYKSEDVENEFGGWHYEHDFNYKIGFLDSEGSLLESYDTGMPFFSNHFGINEVTMYYTPEAITLTVRGGKAISGFTGTFDMETHEFSAVPLENG